jgi:hypothetical protein
MKSIKFIDKNKSNTHKIKNMMDILCEPRKHNSHHRPNIAKPGAQRDKKSCKNQ